MTKSSSHFFAPELPENKSNVIHVLHIPPKYNDVHALLKYFKKYGSINSIYSNGTVATITYDSIESAIKAYNDPNSFLNNRFIKLRFQENQEVNESELLEFSDKERVSRFVQTVNNEIAEEINEVNRIRQSLLEERSKKYEIKKDEL